MISATSGAVVSNEFSKSRVDLLVNKGIPRPTQRIGKEYSTRYFPVTNSPNNEGKKSF